MISGKLWLVAAVVFTVVNATYSVELAAAALAVTVLGGATCCALGYLMNERAMRPVVARALAGAAPPRSRGPSVARPADDGLDARHRRAAARASRRS